jgi:site-specific DNA-methyltransferase (adenine-specific)
MELHKGDCLEIMKDIPTGSIDAITTDPPYGTTACKWDSVIPFELMWEQLKRIIKPKGAIVLFGSEPFSSALRMSNIKNYKYDWIWDKKRCTGFLNAKKQPLRNNETISVFYKKQCTYNPQPYKKNTNGNMGKSKKHQTDNYGKYYQVDNDNSNEFGYPRTLITQIPVVNNLSKDKSGLHPTQKPVALMEYLIKTYTNEGETVLDFTMGSGSTGVACVNTNRKFIGIEMDSKYFEIAEQRIKEAEYKLF